MILHSLLEHGVLPRLANDEIGPLNYNNGHKEGRVAGVLQDLPVGVRPFLAVRVLQVIDSLRVPGSPESQQSGRPEAVLCHDDEVDKEASRGLDHSNLPVRH